MRWFDLISDQKILCEVNYCKMYFDGSAFNESRIFKIMYATQRNVDQDVGYEGEW